MDAKTDQAAVRERLELIADQNGGVLTPAAVVEDARAPDSPLHALFTWDESRGFERYLLSRAREVIRAVRVVVRRSETTHKVPVFVRRPDATPSEQGYVRVSELRLDPDRARDAVVREFASATASLKRARSIAAALGLDREIDQTIDTLDGLRRRALETVEVAGHA